MRMTVIRWGILGPGNVANAIAEDMRLEESAELVAVGSRSPERAMDSLRIDWGIRYPGEE
jgi:predicted dehydrogenase